MEVDYISSGTYKSPMSEKFHDWLDKCPVSWYREKITKIDVHYSFDIEETPKKSIN